VRAAVIIPARLESSRLPAKMLIKLGPRRLIEWTWLAACRTGFPVWIATDASRIEEEAKRFGAEVIPDSPHFVVNWQGDSPCTPPAVAGRLVDFLEEYPDASVTTPVREVSTLEPDQACAVATPEDSRALYFSRQPIPTDGPYLAHVGLYAYRASALRQYGTATSGLERAERLEQNRWLEMNAAVRCVLFDGIGTCPEVNWPHDLNAVAHELGV
jgi:3-deoxy-manno-octulosonate cytidylyltransferase (CMP-KDO synthetase)